MAVFWHNKIYFVLNAGIEGEDGVVVLDDFLVQLKGSDVNDADISLDGLEYSRNLVIFAML